MNPGSTPNVVVQNPTVRKVMGVILGVAAIVLPTIITFDMAADNVDFSSWTTPLMATLLFLSGLFGLTVTTPNVPSGRADDLEKYLSDPEFKSEEEVEVTAKHAE